MSSCKYCRCCESKTFSRLNVQNTSQPMPSADTIIIIDCVYHNFDSNVSNERITDCHMQLNHAFNNTNSIEQAKIPNNSRYL